MMFLRVHTNVTDYESLFSKETTHCSWLDTRTLRSYERNSHLTHPAPVNRDVEIADHSGRSPKSRIVEQMTNGVFVRMAIIEAVL